MAELSAVREPVWKIYLNYSGPMKAVVSPRWQFISPETLGESLFNRTQDPAQNQDLSRSPGGLPVTAALLHCLKELPSNLRPEKCGIVIPAKPD